jgi:type II secretion system protein I
MVPRNITDRRNGLTLLEVLVALAIFLLAVVGLGTLVSYSGERAAQIRQQAWAIQRCQSKLAEVVVGAVPLESQSEVPFDEDPEWIWSLDVQDGATTGLKNVTVRVSRSGNDRSRTEVLLAQIIMDPALRGGAAPAASAEPSSSGSTTPSTGGGTGSQPSGGNTGGRP